MSFIFIQSLNYTLVSLMTIASCSIILIISCCSNVVSDQQSNLLSLLILLYNSYNSFLIQSLTSLDFLKSSNSIELKYLYLSVLSIVARLLTRNQFYISKYLLTILLVNSVCLSILGASSLSTCSLRSAILSKFQLIFLLMSSAIPLTSSQLVALSCIVLLACIIDALA